MKKRNKMIGNISLLLTALIWGFAFVAQSKGMDYVGPFTFQSVRSFLGAAALVPIILVMDRRKKSKKNGGGETDCGSEGAQNRELLQAGVICGVLMAVASCLQQVGIQYTTVGKAGFLTSLYLVIVPVLGIFLGKRVPARIWGCVILCLAGIYLLSITEKMALSRGDAYVILCAFVFALHILAVDRFAPNVDGVKLSCLQFLVSGVLSGIPMLLAERPTLEAIGAAGLPILYAGIMSCGGAYTLQIIGQKYAEPTTATLLMSMESVFSLLGGILLLHQIPSGQEAVGCVLVFAAVILAQLPLGEKGAT